MVEKMWIPHVKSADGLGETRGLRVSFWVAFLDHGWPVSVAIKLQEGHRYQSRHFCEFA